MTRKPSQEKSGSPTDLKAAFPSAGQILDEAMAHITVLEQHMIPDTCRMRYIHRNDATAAHYDRILMIALTRKMALLEIRDARTSNTIDDKEAVLRIGKLRSGPAGTEELTKILSELKDLIPPASNQPLAKP